MRKNHGVTLIALVITIIVLGILATISVTMLTGDKGIINQAKDAKEDARGVSVEEARDLWFLDLDSGIDKSLEDVLADLKEQELLTDDEINTILTSEDNSIQIGDKNISFYYEKESEDSGIVEADPSLWIYELDPETNNTTAILTGYKGTGRPTEMVIPNYIDGIPIKKVTGKNNNGGLSGSLWQNPTDGGGISDDGVDSSKYYYSYQTSIKKLVVSEGIEELGPSTFAYSKAMEEVVLPSTLKKIGNFSFAFCESLTEIMIPRSTVLGSSVFMYSLSNITVYGYSGIVDQWDPNWAGYTPQSIITLVEYD